MKSSTILRRQVGSLFIVGLEGVEFSALEAAWLRGLQPSGIILFKRNIASPRQMHALWQAVATTRQTDSAEKNSADGHSKDGFFRCVDLEGGTVDRLRDLIGPTPAAAAVAATGRPELFQRHGAIVGRMLAALGFNVDLAPVLDLATPACRAVMGSRVASADPAVVAHYARGFLAGLAARGILGCGKHFPGLGSGSFDSHQKTPKIARTWEQMQPDLAPYRVLRGSLPFVMVNHAAYPKIERPKIEQRAQPASLSHFWITEILRKQMKYRGLVLSDDMEMGGVLNHASIEDASVQAIAVGTDLLEVCHRADRILSAYEAVLREAEHSPPFARIVAAASQRVARAKRRWLHGDTLPRAASTVQIDRLRRELEQFSRAVTECAK
jgi:beta-N-acetylhexosaminidase